MSIRKPPPDDQRCTQQGADGRRCRSLRGDGSAFCPPHQRQRDLRHQAALDDDCGRTPRKAAPRPFANALPGDAGIFLDMTGETPLTTASEVHEALRRVLFMIMNNSLSSRGATACIHILRLMLKSGPSVRFERSCAINDSSDAQILRALRTLHRQAQRGRPQPPAPAQQDAAPDTGSAPAGPGAP